MDSRNPLNPYSQSPSYVGLLNSQNFPYESYPSTLKFGASRSLLYLNTPKPSGSSKRKAGETCSKTSSATVGDHEVRPESIKAAKAKRNNAQGKSLEDLMMKEKLSKLAILDTLLAKKEPLSEAEEIVKNKLLAQYF
ncbi:hypothetical protein Bca52824_024267 [Brassica carinata]|uniref:No apical meristem-associated C-terminal domain-containing protein n=1 Tax=Brassica carinata TaxID=52824 RepID=A0A8X7VJW0_BRACI|nr:hypothetical protein Bca52824_024267 [Brassica carinata]